jgi:hypothetical protein
MTKILKAIVPPTKNQGNCSLLGFSNSLETYKQNILWQYNRMREHDGLPHVRRMPYGTKYSFKCYFGNQL